MAGYLSYLSIRTLSKNIATNHVGLSLLPNSRFFGLHFRRRQQGLTATTVT